MRSFWLDRWHKLDPGWRFAIIVFLAARIALSAWAFAVGAMIPFVVSNLDWHGEPVVAAFDMRTSARAVFSRVLDGKELHFHAAYPNLIDAESNSVWDLAGRAMSGERAGAALSASAYTAEEVFPYRGVAASLNIWLAPWQRFDANWFLKIAAQGYADSASAVYFPLYPFFIRILGTIFLGNDLLAAIVISNLALVGALYLLYEIAGSLNDPLDAQRALVFFVLFPTAFFLFAPYTESLFLFVALAALREGQRAHWVRAGIFGALAALTRLQGVLLIVPLAYLWWKTSRLQASGFWFHFLRLTPLLLIPMSSLGFLAFTNLSLLNTYASELHARFVFPWENIIAAVTLIASGGASFVDFSNLVITILFGALVVLVWFKLPRELGWYSVAMYLAPLFRMTTEQPLVSMTRYVLAIFPVFILWGRWGRDAWVERAIVYLSIPLQLYFSAQFFLWGWVG